MQINFLLSLKLAMSFCLLTLFIIPTYSQSHGKYLITELDYDVQSGFNFPIQWAKGTIKYAYDLNKNLISIKTFNKYDLNDVQKYDFEYAYKKLVVKHGGLIGNLILDAQGRVIEASYLSALKEYSKEFPYNYKFKYSADGYIERITAYSGSQIYTIYQLNYKDGNLISMVNLYNGDSYFNPPNYEFVYTDFPVILNWNVILGFYINLQTDKFPIYAIPNNLFGKQCKNLVKTIIVHGTYDSVYNIEYNFNSDGLVSQITIPFDDYKSTFNLISKKLN